MKALVLGGRYPPFALDGVEVVVASRAEGDDVVALLIGARDRIGPEELARLPALRVIATDSVGYDHVDLDAAGARGVWVCHVPDYCVDEVAEHALALLLALRRGVVAFDRARRWSWRAGGDLTTIGGSRLGVVGLGRIGSALAAKARALGAEVVAADPYVDVPTVPLDELLGSCDAVSLHVPLTEETRGLIGARELALMPAHAVLVNTARGAVVDVDALVAALRAKRLVGAALDVLPEEPPPSWPDAPNLIVTPHAAWYSETAQRRAFDSAVAAVRAVLAGEEPAHAVLRPQ